MLFLSNHTHATFTILILCFCWTLSHLFIYVFCVRVLPQFLRLVFIDAWEYWYKELTNIYLYPLKWIRSKGNLIGNENEKKKHQQHERKESERGEMKEMKSRRLKRKFYFNWINAFSQAIVSIEANWIDNFDSTRFFYYCNGSIRI